MRRVTRTLLGSLVALGMLAMVPAAVFAAQPLCGATLTSSTTLTGDLDCSAYAGDALTFGANKITLNLNGHTLWGPTGSDGYRGVFTNGYNKDTVTNGSIKNFDHGVVSSGSNRTTISKLTIAGEGTGSEYGVEVSYGVSVVVDHVNISSTYYGVVMENGATQTLKNSTLAASYIGLYTEYETKDLISNNTATAPYGFYDDYSEKQTYSGNTANGGTTGFYIDCDGYGKVFLTNNTANGNSDYGFYVYDCYDASYAGGVRTGSQVTGNTANGGGTGFYDYYTYNGVWKNNTANDNTSDGFYFYYPVNETGTKNIALRNGDDGFDIVSNYSYYNFDDFSYNTAKKNSDRGFTADYGVPGSGNVGKNNTSWNCYNVDCN